MDTTDSILKRTKESQKTYSFSDNHDPHVPADHWFQNPYEGYTLFIVLYTQACRWAQCLGCNLPSLMSQHHISYKDLMKQIDHLFKRLLNRKQKTSLKKIILSNNGSVFDEKTFSTTALIYFIAMMNLHCPNIRILSIESRVEYVDWEELEVLSRALKEGDTPTELEIAVGFEAYDEKIRNEYFNKGLPLVVFENLVRMMAEYGFRLKVYFMQKPVPQMTEAEAIEDVIQGIGYLHQMAEKYKIDINMHLNPTYVAKGTALEKAFKAGQYEPPLLESVRKAVVSAEGKGISLFIGLYDEGLAVPGGIFIREGDKALVQRMTVFNQTQDFALLK